MKKTGMKDKKGIGIYEGDELEYTLTYIQGHPKHKHIVRWGKWSCGCCNLVYGFDFGDLGEDPEKYAEIIRRSVKDDN